jgi:putative FmdB family regulatory protein
VGNTARLTLPDRRSRIISVGPRVQAAMPHYEFFCHECKKLFSKILTLVDYEDGEVVCPHCGSKNVEQRWSAFSALTSRGSA